jgi:hypothetical protein
MPIGLSRVKYGVPWLVQGITRRLFVSDTERYFDGMRPGRTATTSPSRDARLL